MALVQAGHERAFAAIVERYRPELYALARRLSSDGNGEDVLQQAFLGAFAALRAGVEVRHLRGWLYRIVRNAAASSRTNMYIPLDGATASPEVVEDIVQQRALALNALAELRRLPNRQRQAIVGAALDGRSRAEIASSMGLSEGAVRQLTHRARARLRSAVTAVTPWPAAQWIAGRTSGGGNSVEVVAGAGAGAVSTGGFFGAKLGIVLASGAIATGVAAVDIHASRHPAAPHQTARLAPPSGHLKSALRGVTAVEIAAVSPGVVSPALIARAVVAPAAGDPTVVRPAVFRSGVPGSASANYAGASGRSRNASTGDPVRRPKAPGGAGTRAGQELQHPEGGGMQGGGTDAGATGGGRTDTSATEAGARGRGDGGRAGGDGSSGQLNGGGVQDGRGRGSGSGGYGGDGSSAGPYSGGDSGSGAYGGGDGRGGAGAASGSDSGAGAGSATSGGGGSGAGSGSGANGGQLTPELARDGSGNGVSPMDASRNTSSANGASANSGSGTSGSGTSGSGTSGSGTSGSGTNGSGG